MKRVLITIGGLLVLALIARFRVELPAADQAIERTASAIVGGADEADAAKEPAAAQAGAADSAASAGGEFIPTSFPKAKVLAHVTEPADAQGRQREIETVETGMKERYVRVIRTLQSDGNGGLRRVSAEVAMVANQLLLQKPDSLEAATFVKLLRQAGAVNVKQIGEAYLATFTAAPQDPRALDAYIHRVKEVAGADVTVEPNYIRKLF